MYNTKKMLLRSIPMNVEQLAGLWEWTTDSERKYVLKVSATKIRSAYSCLNFGINSSDGHLIAQIDAYHLCRWLRLEQLIVLNQKIAIQAASIGLMKDQLGKLIGCNDQSIAIAELDPMNLEVNNFVEVTLSHASSEEICASKNISLNFLLSIQILLKLINSGEIKKPSTNSAGTNLFEHFAENHFSIEVGVVSIKIQQVKNLACGDFLLLHKQHANQFTLRIRSKMIEVDVQEGSGFNEWVIIAVHHLNSPETEQWECISLNDRLGKGNLMNVDDISIELSVRLAKAKIKSVDLMRLEPGAIIVMEVIDGPAVDIVCNEKIIAKGYLVDLDGQLAVEIHKICQSI